MNEELIWPQRGMGRTLGKETSMSGGSLMEENVACWDKEKPENSKGGRGGGEREKKDGKIRSGTFRVLWL